MADPDGGSAAPSIRGGLSPEASRLFRAYRTISNMLSKRGYMIPKEMREMTPASFKHRFGEHPARESLTILVVSNIETARNMRRLHSYLSC
jgi:DNA-directed RNA polymerases I, II, and III subunit RPABC1